MPVTGNDHERLGDEVDELVVFFENRAFLKVVAAAHGTPLLRCAALQVTDGRFACRVYDRRPQICRDLERGSPACAGERVLKEDEKRKSLAVVNEPYSAPMNGYPTDVGGTNVSFSVRGEAQRKRL